MWITSWCGLRPITTGGLRPRGGIDDRTADDLDLDELFLRLDRTLTPIGRQTLYARLRRLGGR